MQLQFSAEDEAFRLEVREFVRTRLPADIRRKVELGLRLEHRDYVTWFNLLEERGGWLTPGWPREYGGPGWNHVQRYLFDEETQLGNAPRIIASGVMMLGPVLMRFGTPEQKAKYLPDIRASRTWWAQGFSEPGAGSDLATLRTSAVLEPDGRHFVVNGHKVWTSYAQWCPMMFALVRTDPAAKPQEGISFLLIDLASPGVKVRPIRMLEGGADLNEVFLDNVRVPVENLVGELNKGWTCAKVLLGHERTGIAGIGSCKQQLARARTLAQRQGLGDDPLIQARLAQFEAELMALEFTALRLLSDRQDSRVPGTQASILKVRGTELRQAVFELLLEIAGPDAVPFDPETLFLEHLHQAAVREDLVSIAANGLDARKLTLYGGANEVQRNLIAREALAA